MRQFFATEDARRHEFLRLEDTLIRLGLDPRMHCELAFDAGELEVRLGQGGCAQHSRNRPSIVQQRAEAAGLVRWHVAHGHPARTADLALLEQRFLAEGWLAEDIHYCPKGRWVLEIDAGFRLELPSRSSLALLDTADGDLDRVVFGVRLMADGLHEDAALAQVAHCRRPLARQRLLALRAWWGDDAPGATRWSPLVQQALARQPAPLRWALLHATSPKSGGLDELNWTAFADARRSPRAQLRYLPTRAHWEHLTGTSARTLRLPFLTGFKFGVLHALCREFGVSLAEPARAPVQGWLPAFIVLVRLFGDYAAIRRFVTQGHPWTLGGLHDSGQFQLPPANEEWTPAKWAGLCQRHPRAVDYAPHFPRLEAGKHAPQSLAELRQLKVRMTYPSEGAAWRPLQMLCADLGLTAQEYHDYKTFWQKKPQKPADFMPGLCLDGGPLGLPGWALRKLDMADLRGPMLGLLTGCCQHLRGAGGACARHGVTSPFSAFYVVERNGVVVVQSWVWRNNAGGLVLDSIESRERTPDVIAATAKLWAAAAPYLLRSPLGISALFVGDCHSGITSAVREQWTQVGAEALTTTPADYADYYDGEHHRCWAGRPGRRQALPAIAGYSPCKAPPSRGTAARDLAYLRELHDLAREFGLSRQALAQMTPEMLFQLEDAARQRWSLRYTDN